MTITSGFIAPKAPPPVSGNRPWTATRIAGHFLMALWIIAGASLLLYLGENAFSPFVQKYWPKYVSGFKITLLLVFVSILIGAALSIPIALARASKYGVFRWPAYAYVYFFRGTPLLAQTFLIYYGSGTFRDVLQDIGVWWFFREAWYCVVFAFALNTSAYQAEILRGAIQNVPKGQWEGGQALGLSRAVIFYKIILPQALMVALRPYGNEIILMLKSSAIAAIVTIYDLMGETRRAYSRSFDFQAYLWAAVLYLIVVEALRRVWDQLEARLTRHLQR